MVPARWGRASCRVRLARYAASMKTPSTTDGALESLLDLTLLDTLQRQIGAKLAPIIHTYHEDAGRTMATLLAAVSRRDAPAIRAGAHRLNGGSAALGLTRLATACAALEAGAAYPEVDALLRCVELSDGLSDLALSTWVA